MTPEQRQTTDASAGGPSPAPSLAAIVAQHARTCELLGVDFLPAYPAPNSPLRRGAPVEVIAPEPGVPAPSPEPTPVMPRSTSARKPDSKQKSKPESKPDSKPAGPAPVPSAPPSPAVVVAPSKLPPAPPIPGWNRPAPAPGESDRDYRVRALAALRARYEADAPHKHFVTAHTSIVFHDGDPASPLVFVGEAPGEEEDRTGTPFVGRAGELLNNMLTGGMGVARSRVYICNVLKTRPPNNATPTTREAALCEPYLLEQLGIVAPRVIVTLGLSATRLLLRTDQSMERLHGTWAELKLPGAGTPSQGRVVQVMPTYHPAYLLRSYTPENRRKVWQDLQLVVQRLKDEGAWDALTGD